MPEIRLRISDEEAADLEARAVQAGQSRRDYVRTLLLAPDRPVDEAELRAMVSAKARAGSMEAIRILARMMPEPAAMSAGSSVEVEVVGDPFAEFDELAERRRRGAG
jgi:hypothetical protein